MDKPGQWSIRLSLLFLVLFSLSCSGNNSAELQKGQIPGQATGPQDAGSAGGPAQSRFTVRMNPQAELEGGLKAASSIELRLSGLTLPTRSASSTEVTIPAVDFRQDLINRRVEVKGDYLVYRPIWNNPTFDNLDDAAIATYQIDLTGYSGIPTVGFDWAENGLPRIPDKYYVALSNWGGNRWSWFDGPLDQVLTLDDYAPYTDENGKVLITVLALQRESVIVLHNLTIGAPEQRGTGFEYEDIPISTSVPAMYVPTLPDSVDLSPGCAPVNDQGSWGSCTAFAVGDGAYNYELNSIYESIGWNLDSAAFRVSPKFLYVESGKDQGFPPGGDYGRYTDQVARGMTVFGIATEQNAPYDMQYNDNWSIGALNDAQVLKSRAYTALPCRNDEGIDSIKTVLAFQQRPVLVSTQVDNGLFGYLPDTVWDFQGPSYGGHAMLIVGFDNGRQAFRVRNSWGSDWGDDGYLWMSYNSLKHPYNWYAQCGFIRDEYDNATAMRFTGTTIDLLPPAAMQASDGSAGSNVIVSWEAVDNATGYRIYRDTLANMVIQTGLDTQYIDSTVTDSLAHSYWVTALQSSSESPAGSPDIGYTAQSPSVEGVYPQAGSEGQVIRFVPQATGDAATKFAWDFGGGAIPNTSTLAGPVVVLGAEGDYSASLSVTGAEGTIQYDWTLTVKLNEPPFAYLTDNNNDSGIVPYECTLEATGGDNDGFIVLYEFDWESDGVYDLVTTENIVVHTYTEVGSYTAKVRVMDDAGLYDTATENISVVQANWAPWPTISADPPSGPAPLNVHFDSAGTYDQDGTVEYYEWDFDNDGTVDAEGPSLVELDHQYASDGTYTALLRVTDNEGATGEITTEVTVGLPLIPGWTSHVIHHWSDGTNYRRVMAALVEDKPAVLSSTNAKGLEYFASSVAIPDAGNDWSGVVAIASGGLDQTTQMFGLCDNGGYALGSFSSGSLSTVQDFSGAWLEVNVDSTANCGQSSSVAIINGKPAVAYTHTFNPNDIYYAYSSIANSELPGDWVITEVDTAGNPSVGTELMLIDIGGLPYIAYGKRDPAPDDQRRLWLARGLSSTPAGPADWVLHKVDEAKNTGNEMALTVLAGRPAIAYSFADGPKGMRFAWADSAVPASTTDWNIMTVETGKAGIPSVAVVNGVPMFCYVANSPNGGLTLAQASNATPAGDGDWSFQRLFSVDLSSGSCSLIAVNNKPAIAFGWNPAFSVVYITPAP